MLDVSVFANRRFSGGSLERPGLQKLLRFVCERGFEHHVAANFSNSASAVHEATTRYLNWDVHFHKADAHGC